MTDPSHPQPRQEGTDGPQSAPQASGGPEPGRGGADAADGRTAALDPARKYLVPVARLDLPDEPDVVHLAVHEWQPMLAAWVTGQAICGRSSTQGALPEDTPVTCPDCARLKVIYEDMFKRQAEPVDRPLRAPDEADAARHAQSGVPTPDPREIGPQWEDRLTDAIHPAGGRKWTYTERTELVMAKVRELLWERVTPLLPTGPAGALRDQIAKALHRYDYDHGLTGNDIPGDHHRGEAAAVLATPELAQRLAHLADYENRITWETNCGEHARLLDSCYAETVRAEKAEAELARVSALHADTERRLKADLRAAVERAENAEQQITAVRQLHSPCEERHLLDLSATVAPHCDTCVRQPWPCPTAAALDNPKES